MSGRKFTDGPWQYRPHKYDDWGVVRRDDNMIVCVCSVADFSEAERNFHRQAKTDPVEATARLIAAAPDMYEALAAFVAYDDGDTDDIDMMVRYAEAIKLARAALAKADGTP